MLILINDNIFFPEHTDSNKIDADFFSGKEGKMELTENITVQFLWL